MSLRPPRARLFGGYIMHIELGKTAKKVFEAKAKPPPPTPQEVTSDCISANLVAAAPNSALGVVRIAYTALRDALRLSKALL